MKASRFLIATAFILLCAVGALTQSSAPARPQAPVGSAAVPTQTGQGTAKLPPAVEASIEKKVEQFLRNVSAWGPEFQLQVGPINTSISPDIYEVPVKVSIEGQTEGAVVYVSKDGKFIISGEIADLSMDPLADNRSMIHTEGFGSKGPADAKVTVVEFADLECPDCRQFEGVLRSVLPKYPQVRFVFKDFPLESIHPWAAPAAVASHCVLQQSSDAFWKFHDSLFDNQNLISPENAVSKLAEYASAAGADLAKYQACMVDPKSADIVKASIEEGRSLKVSGTPTTFVNGRRLVGPDPNLLRQYLDYDLNNAR